MLVCILEILCLVILISGCADQPARNESPQVPTAGSPVETIPPLLPMTIGDVLQLPNISIDEASGIGPGFRYWSLTTNHGFPYVYAEAYDEPFLTKLEVTVYTSEPGTISDHLGIIHETLCRLRPDDPWFKTTWPDSGASGFSLPASVIHDGMVLEVSRKEKWATLAVTATAEDPENSK